MNLHEGIRAAIARFIEERRDCVIISPGAIASAIYLQFASAQVEAHIAYASIEHFKQMARHALRARFDDDGEENPAYTGQGELFSNRLQERYPVPRKADEDPVYKRLEDLTRDELRWNVRSLRRSADARLAHADALDAYSTQHTIPA